MATYTVTTGRKTFKDATGADTYNISGDATRVTIAGKLVSGDIINIEGLASEYTVRASGRTVTLSNGVQTVVFQLSNVNGSASVRFMDGDLTASFNGKNAFLGTQKLGKKAAEVNDSVMGTSDSSSAFTGSSGTTGSTFTLTTGAGPNARISQYATVRAFLETAARSALSTNAGNVGVRGHRRAA